MLKHDYAAALEAFNKIDFFAFARLVCPDHPHCALTLTTKGGKVYKEIKDALAMMQKLQNPSKAMIDAAYTRHALGGVATILDVMMEQATKEIEDGR